MVVVVVVLVVVAVVVVVLVVLLDLQGFLMALMAIAEQEAMRV